MENVLVVTNVIILVLGALAIKKDTNSSVKLLVTTIVALAAIGLIGYFVGKTLFYATH